MAKNKDKDDVSVDEGFNPKYMKLINDWVSSVESLSAEELEKTVILCEKQISEVERDLDADEHLKALKEEIKIVSSGFRDVLKREEAKVRYCIYLLNSRGAKVS